VREAADGLPTAWYLKEAEEHSQILNMFEAQQTNLDISSLQALGELSLERLQ